MLTGIAQSGCSNPKKRYNTFQQWLKIAVALKTGMDYPAGLTDEIEPYRRERTQ